MCMLPTLLSAWLPDAFKRLDGLRPGDWAGFSGPKPALVASQQQRFDAMRDCGAIVVVFAARQLDEQQAVAARSKLGADRRPWFRIGLVAAAEVSAIPQAVLAQRQLLIDSARVAHKELRPLTNLALAWGPREAVEEAEAAAEPVSLGSFRCGSCGHQNDAAAGGCANCGAPRDEFSPRGVLSRVVLTRGSRPPCAIEECGFASASARGG